MSDETPEYCQHCPTVELMPTTGGGLRNLARQMNDREMIRATGRVLAALGWAAPIWFCTGCGCMTPMYAVPRPHRH